MLIESEGLLFRGPSPDRPTEIWDYVQQNGCLSAPGTWTGQHASGVQIDERRAERLKTDNVDAEHYRYYDFPPWLRSGKE